MKNPFSKLSKYALRYNPFDYFIARRILKRRARQRATHRGDQFYWLFWRAFKTLAKKLFNWKAEGVTNIPATGAAVIVSNHNNFADPVFIGIAVPREMSYVSKIENYDVPILRTLLMISYSIPLKRGENDRVAFQQMRRVLRNEGIIGIFPEGTRSKTRELGHFHSGAARLCLEFGIPYVPVGIIGNLKLKINHPIRVKIGKPVYPESDLALNYRNAQLVAAQMKERVRELLNDLENNNKTNFPISKKKK